MVSPGSEEKLVYLLRIRALKIIKESAIKSRNSRKKGITFGRTEIRKSKASKVCFGAKRYGHDAFSACATSMRK